VRRGAVQVLGPDFLMPHRTSKFATPPSTTTSHHNPYSYHLQRYHHHQHQQLTLTPTSNTCSRRKCASTVWTMSTWIRSLASLPKVCIFSLTIYPSRPLC
jgi:hypothetical protein